MKILLCNERFLFRFGVDRVLLTLGQGLDSRGHNIYVMANQIDRKPVEAFAKKIIEIPQFESDYLNLNETTALWLAENFHSLFSASEKPDLVIVGGWPFFSSIPVFKSLNVKVVFNDHGAVPLDGFKDGALITQQKLRSMRRAYIPQADEIISVSNFIANSQSMPDCNNGLPVHSVKNGADHLERPGSKLTTTDFFNSLFKKGTLTKSKGLKTLLNLGRWENGNYKNSNALFEVVRQIQKDIPEVVALVLSDGTDLIIPDDLTKAIICIGYPSDEELRNVMANVDAGVSVSLWEGFNLPLAEMQWLGKKVVVFNIGAHPEVVALPWFLAEDIKVMAEKLVSCLLNTAPPNLEHEKAIERFHLNFTWKSTIDAYEEIMLSLTSFPDVAQFPNFNVLIDVTNSARDPANSGVIRVSRSLCRSLQTWCNPIFILWDSSLDTYVYPTLTEYTQLAAFNGPERQSYHIVSANETRIKLAEDLNRLDYESAWLLLTETIIESNGKRIRAFASQYKLKIASIFYDAIPLIRPDLCKDQVILKNHADYMQGLAESDIVFPISKFSDQCLTSFWNERDIASTITFPTLLPDEFHAGPRLTVPSLFDSNRIRILCVSTLEPRKNHRRLLDALDLLSEKYPHIDWSLTLIGNRYAGDEELATFIQNACKKDYRIQWLGITDDKTLRAQYETCSFTVYPSFIEGYGMPIVESLWHGKPCICHNEGVMAELAVPGGCLTTDVLDVHSLCEAIMQLATNRELYDKLSDEAVIRNTTTWATYSQKILSRMIQLSPPQRAIIPATHPANTSNAKMTTESNAAKEKKLPFNSYIDILYPDCLTGNWQMNDSERLALMALLHRHQPRCCIEIGTYQGGSLSLISQYAEMVFSIDIDVSIPSRFSYFSNVSFLTGPSQQILPYLFKELDREGIPVDFILIDGDHSANGIKRDLDLIFEYVPKAPLFVMMHDSFNQECRRGMREANWSSAKYVQWVDLDFIPGRLIEHGGGGNGELWGGLGCALFGPSEKTASVPIGESARQLQNWATQFRTS